ncbi:hypothetical protein [Marinobacter sp. SS21]|uniref:hypothetical protein n=1 Tax=Marinobacter sp. SS21 TaxID=2979460 RepID=UPI00232B2BFB|nr:hypothetical protein [Marinobacter sp. SS21]MDC0661427.1 hypothetical protein [Marinobacter sp. SS21]
MNPNKQSIYALRQLHITGFALALFTIWFLVNAGGCSSYYLDQNGRNSAAWP